MFTKIKIVGAGAGPLHRLRPAPAPQHCKLNNILFLPYTIIDIGHYAPKCRHFPRLQKYCVRQLIKI